VGTLQFDLGDVSLCDVPTFFPFECEQIKLFDFVLYKVELILVIGAIAFMEVVNWYLFDRFINAERKTFENIMFGEESVAMHEGEIWNFALFDKIDGENM
jgi:hypothetical protein